jgi:hypothetical protein
MSLQAQNVRTDWLDATCGLTMASAKTAPIWWASSAGKPADFAPLVLKVIAALLKYYCTHN